MDPIIPNESCRFAFLFISWLNSKRNFEPTEPFLNIIWNDPYEGACAIGNQAAGNWKQSACHRGALATERLTSPGLCSCPL